jgi:hypothetical protein
MGCTRKLILYPDYHHHSPSVKLCKIVSLPFYRPITSVKT